MTQLGSPTYEATSAYDGMDDLQPIDDKSVLRRYTPWGILVAILLLLLIPPLISLIQGSLQKGGGFIGGSGWTFGNYSEVLSDAVRGGASSPLVNSILFSIGSAIFAIIFGGILAFLVERTNMPYGSLGYVVSACLIAFPVLTYGIAWNLIFNQNGIADHVLRSFHLGIRHIQIDSLPGMIIVQGATLIPVAFLLLVGPIRSIDRHLEEAALTSGANGLQMVRYISTPLLLPGVAAVLFLTTMRSLEAFAVPAVIGEPGRVQVLTTDIYAATRQTPPDVGTANAFGVLLLVIVVGFLWVYSSLSANASRFHTVGGQGHKPRMLVMSSRARIACVALVVLYFLVLVVVPLLVLLWASFQPFYAGPSLKGLTLTNYHRLASYPGIVSAFVNSILSAAGAATAVMVLALASSWIGIRGRSKHRRRVLGILGSFALVFPGLVIGLALLQLYLRLSVPVYGTVGILIIAYTTRFVPWGIRFTDPGVLSIHPELEEAAAVAGAHSLQVAWRVLLPILRVSLIAGWVYVFLMSSQELEASVLLVTSNMETVSPLLLAVWSSGTIPQIAALSVAILAVFGVIGVLVQLLLRRVGRNAL